MPQLSPHPWLYSLLVVWAVLLFLLLPATLKNKHPHLPSTPSLEGASKPKKETWKWH